MNPDMNSANTMNATAAGPANHPFRVRLHGARRTARTGLLALALLLGGLAPGLSGCAVLHVDVDVYKGPLTDHEDMQVNEMIAMAVAAKPILVRLRDTLEWGPSRFRVEAMRREAQRQGWYKHGYIDHEVAGEAPGFDQAKLDFAHAYPARKIAGEVCDCLCEGTVHVAGCIAGAMAGEPKRSSTPSPTATPNSGPTPAATATPFKRKEPCWPMSSKAMMVNEILGLYDDLPECDSSLDGLLSGLRAYEREWRGYYEYRLKREQEAVLCLSPHHSSELLLLIRQFLCPQSTFRAMDDSTSTESGWTPVETSLDMRLAPWNLISQVKSMGVIKSQVESKGAISSDSSVDAQFEYLARDETRIEIQSALIDILLPLELATSIAADIQMIASRYLAARGALSKSVTELLDHALGACVPPDSESQVADLLVRMTSPRCIWIAATSTGADPSAHETITKVLEPICRRLENRDSYELHDIEAARLALKESIVANPARVLDALRSLHAAGVTRMLSYSGGDERGKHLQNDPPLLRFGIINEFAGIRPLSAAELATLQLTGEVPPGDYDLPVLVPQHANDYASRIPQEESGLNHARLKPGLDEVIKDYLRLQFDLRVLSESDRRPAPGHGDTAAGRSSPQQRLLEDALDRSRRRLLDEFAVFGQKVAFLANSESYLRTDYGVLGAVKGHFVDLVGKGNYDDTVEQLYRALPNLPGPITPRDESKGIDPYVAILQAIGNAILVYTDDQYRRDEFERRNMNSTNVALEGKAADAYRAARAKATNEVKDAKSGKPASDEESASAGHGDPKEPTYEDRRQIADGVLALLNYELIAAERAGSSETGRIRDAIDAAEAYRASLTFVRPASSYLRTSYAATALQNEAPIGHRNLLMNHALAAIPFTDWFNRSRANARLNQDIDKQFWQRVNEVHLSGAGRTNYVVAKDDIGNWYAKRYSSDPADIIRGARNLALFTMGAGAGVNLMRPGARPEPAGAGQDTYANRAWKAADAKFTEQSLADLKALHAVGTGLLARIGTQWSTAGIDDDGADDALARSHESLLETIGEDEPTTGTAPDPGVKYVAWVGAIRQFRDTLSAGLRGRDGDETQKALYVRAAELAERLVLADVMAAIDARRASLRAFEGTAMTLAAAKPGPAPVEEKKEPERNGTVATGLVEGAAEDLADTAQIVTEGVADTGVAGVEGAGDIGANLLEIPGNLLGGIAGGSD